MTETAKKLVIIGTSSFGEIAYEYFTHDSDYEPVAFSEEADFRKRDSLFGLPIYDLETLEKTCPPETHVAFVALAYGQLNRVRTRICNTLKDRGYTLVSYVSSRSFVWQNVEIGENCFIFEDNTVQPFCKIGRNVILWSGNHIGHHSVIRDNCFFSSHVVLAGHCEVGENCFLGVNSSIANNVQLGKDNFVSLGAVITQNTEENQILRGNPAKPQKLPAKRYWRVKE